jgi:AcrR family transcriptional regulator
VGDQQVRRRDPDRKARILEVSAELISKRGYHSVSLAEIGAAAGIVGSGVYRHFSGKQAILVELLAEAMARLSSGAAAITTEFTDDREALAALVRHHVQIAVRDRDVLRVYHGEIHNLGANDRRRLRREQRLYIEQWVSVASPLRPDLTDAEMRLTVHGAIQSILFHNLGLPEGQMVELLDRMAHDCLGVSTAGPTASRYPRRRESRAGGVLGAH